MKSLIIGAWIAAAAPLIAQEKLPLLDEIISHPGSYAQVCDVMSAPEDIPYRAYQLSGFAGASFSTAKQEAMKANRPALVKAIRARLLEIDLKRAAGDNPKDPKPEVSEDGENVGCDPMTLNPLLLDLIIELDAIEALPELLVVEEKLVKGIAAAKDDSKAKPPVVSGWFVQVEGPYDDKEPEAKRDRRMALFQSRVAQRDLVMTIALLMRGKAYGPFLKTKLETEYVKGLKANAKKNGIENFDPKKPLPPEQEGLEISIDPVSGLPRMKYWPVMIPYTRESRDEVRAAAAKWTSEH
jgi:hypothetical protein